VTAANFALALFAFTPSLITHFSLATTDGAATLLIFAAAIQVRRWQQNLSWRAAVLTGAVLGFLLLAKFSTLPMFALACALLLVLDHGRISIHPLKWNWAKCAVCGVIALSVLWAGYLFHVSHLTIRDGVLTATHPHWNTVLVKPTHSRLNISIPVPAGEYIAGFRDLVFHNAHGHRSFFLGQVSPTGGWKAYCPVTILLKWPILLLIASLAGLGVGLWGKFRVRPEFWILFSFPVLYFALAIFSHFNIGERHVLPLYPFALLLAAALGDWLARKRWGGLLICGFLLLNATDALRYAPSYLSYMDPFVDAATSYRLLSDSNLDWGQGLISLHEYQEQHPSEQISLAYFGSVNPEMYGIRAHKLEENERASGIVVVGATQLSGQYLVDQSGYAWILRYPRVETLNHCMYVFRVSQ